MLREEDIAIELRCQQFVSKCYMRDMTGEKSVLLFESEQGTDTVSCPHCGGKVYADGYGNVTLKDMPVWQGIAQELTFVCHRYECRQCGKKFTEEIPLRRPGTKVTERAARWIQAMLRFKVSIRSIQGLTGIHWETIRKLHLEIMESTLEEHMGALKASGYRPRLLAIDEFAIHKGHTYATCVMDLEKGEVLWVGEGRSKDDFERFFAETDPSFLSDVMAVAMDMNASYHLLVSQHLPNAEIVYDRYHKILCEALNLQVTLKLFILVRSDESISLLEEPYYSSITIKRDSFNKMDRYKNQNEWRLTLYRGIKETRAYILDIGDIRDIVRYSKMDNLTAEIKKMALTGQLKQEYEGYYGNIQRPELRELFYKLGDYKAQMISVIG
ncbi:MAG: transposase [Clostridia bacterium]|nr:transposase [Clostridia bacterium]